jgi:hypothetical protein
MLQVPTTTSATATTTHPTLSNTFLYEMGLQTIALQQIVSCKTRDIKNTRLFNKRMAHHWSGENEVGTRIKELADWQMWASLLTMG